MTDPGAAPPDPTTMHVRRAIDGDEASTAWMVEHFTPVLMLQAAHRLRGGLRHHYGPEDLVQDVWTVALPRLPHLQARERRLTPVLVKFLGTTLLHRVNHVLRGYLRGERRRRSLGSTSQSGAGLEGLSDAATHTVARAARSEANAALREAIDGLDARDREVVVLRGIEQIANHRVAELLGEKPSAVAMRYMRALGRLRVALPNSVFDELPEDPRDSP